MPKQQKIYQTAYTRVILPGLKGVHPHDAKRRHCLHLSCVPSCYVRQSCCMLRSRGVPRDSHLNEVELAVAIVSHDFTLCFTSVADANSSSYGAGVAIRVKMRSATCSRLERKRETSDRQERLTAVCEHQRVHAPGPCSPSPPVNNFKPRTLPVAAIVSAHHHTQEHHRLRTLCACYASQQLPLSVLPRRLCRALSPTIACEHRCRQQALNLVSETMLNPPHHRQDEEQQLQQQQ